MKSRDPRSRYIKRWMEIAKGSHDPYEVFLSLWTAMTIAADMHRPKSTLDNKEGDTNREKITDYMVVNKKAVFGILRKNKKTVGELIRLQGVKYKDPIVDTGDADLRNRFSEIVGYYSGKIKRFRQERMAENLAGLIYTTRYDIFRTKRADTARHYNTLVSLLNRLMAEILRACEGRRS